MEFTHWGTALSTRLSHWQHACGRYSFHVRQYERHSGARCVAAPFCRKMWAKMRKLGIDKDTDVGKPRT